ncbi:hypothetical protein LINPERHAP1_LOCUS7672 [Linum perenne]
MVSSRSAYRRVSRKSCASRGSSGSNRIISRLSPVALGQSLITILWCISGITLLESQRIYRRKWWFGFASHTYRSTYTMLRFLPPSAISLARPLESTSILKELNGESLLDWPLKSILPNPFPQ